MKLGVKKVAGVSFEEAEARANAEADRIAALGAEAAEAERLEKKAAAERAAQRAADVEAAKHQPEAAKTRVNYYQANTAGSTVAKANDDGLARLGMGMGRMGFGSVPSGRPSNGYSSNPQGMKWNESLSLHGWRSTDILTNFPFDIFDSRVNLCS